LECSTGLILFTFNFDTLYFKRSIIVFIATIVLVNAIGFYFDYRYKKAWQHLYFDKPETCLYGKINYDIILLGNSRVNFGLNPYYVDSITHQTTYNLGFMGAGNEMMQLFGTLYLQHHTAPKIAVISMDPYAFGEDASLKKSFFFLYFLSDDTICNSMKSNGWNTTLIRYLPFLKYTFFDEYNRATIFTQDELRANNLYDTNFYKGFVNLSGNMKTKNFTPAENKKEEKILDTTRVDESYLHFLFQLIKECNAAHTQIVLIVPPDNKEAAYYTSMYKSKIVAATENIAAQYQLPCIRFDTMTVFKNNLFIDDTHLNTTGSRIYSIELGKQLNKLSQ
jgi:hypothetical protein